MNNNNWKRWNDYISTHGNCKIVFYKLSMKIIFNNRSAFLNYLNQEPRCYQNSWKPLIYEQVESIVRFEKMWYECPWENSPSMSQFVKVNPYSSKYGLQQRAMAHTEQQDIKGTKNY